MSNIPAFPRPSRGQDGMTLLDYFAGQAITGLIQNNSDATYKELAHDAYRIADEMLRMGEKSNEA